MDSRLILVIVIIIAIVIVKWLKPFRVEDGKLVSGESDPKKIKKQINIHISGKHLIFGLILFSLFILSFYYGIIDDSFLGETQYVVCDNGTKILYDINRTEYCGMNINDYYASKEENIYNNITIT